MQVSVKQQTWNTSSISVLASSLCTGGHYNYCGLWNTPSTLTDCFNGRRVFAERLQFTLNLVLLSPGNESDEGKKNRENANELLIMQFHVGDFGGGGDQLTETMSSFLG